MSPFNFFSKVSKYIGFSYAPSSPYFYEFIRHNIFNGSIMLGDKEYDNVFYLFTTKYIVREKFYTIVLVAKIEILNVEFLLEDESGWEIFSVSREYSYNMKDDKNISEDYSAKDFSLIIKERFKEIYSGLEEDIFNNKLNLLIENLPKNRLERINRIEGARVSGDNPALLATINLALKEI